MAKGKSNSALIALIVGILLIFVGGAAVGFSLMLGAEAENKQIYDIIMYVSIGVVAIGVITLVSGIAVGKKRGKQARQSRDNAEPIADVEINLDGSTVYNGEPTYFPQPQSYEFVTVGRRQSIDDKFEQIGKMGKTQFVIYMSKLFSLKGYEVQLTPVIDNHGIDMIIKRDGVTKAIGCLLANKVMCEEDVAPVREGAAFYSVDGAAAVTNMYFDRTALNFAKVHKMTLIDRNILTEQFMN